MNTRLIQAAVITGLLSGSIVALAADDDEAFRETNTVAAVYPDDRRIVIGDTSFPYSAGLVVHRANGTSAVGPNSLTPGTTVSYTHSNGVIIEIWVERAQ
ncbi:MAG: hypothetical protein H6978_15600 [Gammaproteobacteria bacterium]|nr:hypothetical protein [Gammaproteobacteria bacterium]